MDFYLFLKLFVEILQNLNRFSCRLYSLLLKLLEHQPYVSGPKQIENKQIQVKKVHLTLKIMRTSRVVQEWNRGKMITCFVSQLCR